MQLILENFRQHKYLDLSIPDTGLVKLHGPSGAGKTTIFDAILEALYGEADDVTPWGESKAKVTLRFTNFEIVRTRGPVSLYLKAGSMELRDEAAQHHIDKLMGMGAQEFLASSYIRQGMEGSLLSLTPAEQLRFVQELAVGAYNPETFKEKLADYVKVKTVTLNKTEGEITALASSIAAQAVQIDKKRDQLPAEPTPPEIKFDSAAHAETEKHCVLLAESINKIRARQNSPFYSLVEKLANAKARFKAVCDKNYEKMQDLSDEMKTLTDCGEGQIGEAHQRVELKKRFVEGKAKLLAEIQSFWKSFPEFKELKISTILPSEIKKLSTDIDVSMATSVALAGELDALERGKQALTCPECDAQLKLDSHKLVHFEGATFSPERKAELESQIAAEKAARARWSARKDSFNSILKTCDRLKAEMGTDPDPAMNLVEAIALVNWMVQDRHRLRELDNEIKSLQAYIDSEQAEVDKLEAQLKMMPEMPSKAELAASLVELEAHQTEAVKSVSAGLKLKTEWDLYRSAKSNVESLKKMIQSDQDRLEADQGTLTSLEQVKFNLNVKLSAAKKNKELADFASISACDLILENINEHAREYLDQFFPEDGTSIVLKNTTVTKTGNERPKLSLSIYHKGKDANKLRSLSGGEKSRIFLSFQLALSEMYNSPVLLIDEGFAGLPPDHKAECLEVLKEFAETRLVFVIEHGVNEAQFHDVITLT